jgi:hypothetical protein
MAREVTVRQEKVNALAGGEGGIGARVNFNCA